MSAPHKYDQVGPDGTSTTNITDWKQNDVTLRGTAAITAGDWVAIDLASTPTVSYGTGKQVITADYDTAAHRGAVIGVALETTTGEADIRVRVGGYYSGANVEDAASAGDLLSLDVGGESGRAAAADAHAAASNTAAINGALAARIFALAVTDGDANNDADVLIIDSGFFG